MAKKIVFQLVDDLTGDDLPEDAGETVKFSYEGASYEIDLSAENASEFRSLMGKYANAGRRVVSRRAPRPGADSAGRPKKLDRDTEHVAKVRSWAERQGMKVNKRGRLSAAVIDSYNAAH